MIVAPPPSERLPLAERRPATCPQSECAAPLELPYLCGTCGELLRAPAGMSHFARFGLRPRMDLDLDALERKYIELSRHLHPDRVVGKKPSVQSRALVLSSALNDAYRTLKDRRLRAEHLLAVHGGAAPEQDKSTPQELLLEMMDLHEAVEAAHEAGDRARLEELRALADEREAQALDQVGQAFADPAFPTPELLAAVRQHLNVAKYWVTLRSEVVAALAA